MSLLNVVSINKCDIHKEDTEKCVDKSQPHMEILSANDTDSIGTLPASNSCFVQVWPGVKFSSVCHQCLFQDPLTQTAKEENGSQSHEELSHLLNDNQTSNNLNNLKPYDWERSCDAKASTHI